MTPLIGAGVKPLQLRQPKAISASSYRRNTGKSRHPGVPLAHHLQVVSQLCHLVEFLEPRPYACQLCASRHKPAQCGQQGCNNADRVDYFHFFTFSPSSTRRRMASAPVLQIKKIHNRENDQSDNEQSQFRR
jgi:hypothetical protein